ncbi:MAG: hypothetical protein ABI672_07280 [Vicinamibacteria bacterium]
MRLPPTLFALLLCTRVFAQDEVAQSSVKEPADPFHFGGEIKVGFRWSQAQTSNIFNGKNTPIGLMKTPDAGRSIEIQHLGLQGEGAITPGVFAKFEVRFLDTYNRNPTSTDATVFLRQAFVRFGEKAEPLDGSRDSRLYVLAGMAPRFTKQMSRHFESYGLLGTAIGRFEQPQLQVGGSFGSHWYVRAMIGSGNPLFLRDTNALAGDNLSEGVADARATYGTGFPILYDAKVTDVNVGGHLETGAGLGARILGDEKNALDVLGWYFQRRLSQTARVRGSDYPGELAIFQGAGFPIPNSGDRRHEWGVNIQAKADDFNVFGQWMSQDIAGVSRHGIEAEGTWTLQLPGLFLVGESIFGNWVQASFRVSWIHNDFLAPLAYPRLAIQWPWKKYDFGLRFGMVRNVDLTAEYTFHQVFRTATLPNLPMREFVLTLRTGF